jgi:uncharacterized membrane protein
MELFVSQFEDFLAGFIALLKVVLESLAALTIFFGVIRTAQFVVKLRRKRHHHPVFSNALSFIQIRLTFGMWLALALEFQLGADILATTVAPNFSSLGQLAAIALIRTFLNYFLNKELESEYAFQKEAHDRAPSEPTSSQE